MQVRARNLAVAAIGIAALAIVGATLAALVPTWPFVLFEHFRFQYLWGGALVVVACGALRMRYWFDAVLIATLFNACFVLPDLSRSARPLPADGAPLRVLVLNVLTESTGFAEVAKLIADTKPDVIGLVEVDEKWLTALAPTLAGYPHRIEKPDNDNFGIALFSSLPMTATAEKLGSPFVTIVATVDVRGTPLDVVLTHPIPPMVPAYFTLQLSQLEAVADRVRRLGPRTLVMGDLNATPWSRTFRDFVATTGLCDTRAGFGLQATRPSTPLEMRIPIDHALVSCSIGVKSRTIERDVGSDHLPVLVDLVIPRS